MGEERRDRGGGWSARSREDGGPTVGAATEEGWARLRRPAASPSLRRWDAKLRAMTAPLLLLPPEKERVAIGREDATMASRNNDAGDLLEARAVGGAAFLVVILRWMPTTMQVMSNVVASRASKAQASQETSPPGRLQFLGHVEARKEVTQQL